MGTSEPVGRDAVLRLLSEALTAPADRGGAFLLLGEPGIGKTTCLAAAEAMAREAGHLTLGTAGNKAETKLPFAGLHRLLQPLLASTDTLPDVQRRALRTVLGLYEGGPADRFVISVAVLNLLRDASAHRTLLITADEIDWLDQDTRRILAFVTRQLDRQRVVVVATSSAVDGLPDLRDVFHEVHLPRLDEPAAGRVLDLRAPQLDDARREWVLNKSGRPPPGVDRTRPGATGPRRDPIGSHESGSAPVPGSHAHLRRTRAGSDRLRPRRRARRRGGSRSKFAGDSRRRDRS